jgi:hypothetical protein
VLVKLKGEKFVLSSGHFRASFEAGGRSACA